MIKMNEIIKIQKDHVEKNISAAKSFIEPIDKSDIETILISGSIARGDFSPGKFGGMTDLTVMRRVGSKITPESIFGPNEEDGIPYHCIKRNDIWYSIAFFDFIAFKDFQILDESKKSALLESSILWENNGKYNKELEKIHKMSFAYQMKALDSGIKYIAYLLSEYKKDRWFRREAFIQMHENLNTAIRNATKCLFYINRKYAPAEDRRLYYSFSLDKLPVNYDELVIEINKQQINSEDDYFRREKMFLTQIMKFINTNIPTMSSP